jgi:hypothetical protein
VCDARCQVSACRSFGCVAGVCDANPGLCNGPSLGDLVNSFIQCGFCQTLVAAGVAAGACAGAVRAFFNTLADPPPAPVVVGAVVAAAVGCGTLEIIGIGAPELPSEP